MKNPLCNEVLLIQPLTAEVDGLYSWFIANCVLNIFLSVTAIIFNVVTIQALRRTLSLPETLKILLMSLAISDLGVGFLVQPLLVVLLFNWFRMSVENSSTCAVYTAYTLFGTLHSSASFFGVMALSADRFLAIHLHLRYKELITIKRAIVVLVIIWIIGAHSGTLWLYKPNLVKWNVIVIIQLCLMAAIVSYFQIYRAVTRAIHSELTMKCSVDQNCEAMNMARFKSHTLSTFLVYCLIMLCYLPYFCVVVVIAVTGPSVPKRFAYDMTAVGVFINSSLNPLVYCWRLGDVRNAVRKTAKLMVPAKFRGGETTMAP